MKDLNEINEIIDTQGELLISLYKENAPSWRIEVETCVLEWLIEERDDKAAVLNKKK